MCVSFAVETSNQSSGYHTRGSPDPANSFPAEMSQHQHIHNRILQQQHLQHQQMQQLHERQLLQQRLQQQVSVTGVGYLDLRLPLHYANVCSCDEFWLLFHSMQLFSIKKTICIIRSLET